MPCILVRDYTNNPSMTSCLYCSNVCDAQFPKGCSGCHWPDVLLGCSLRSKCPCFQDPTPERTASIMAWQRHHKADQRTQSRFDARIKRRRASLEAGGHGWEVDA